MFEQSFLNGSAKTHRTWSVAVSFVGQVALAGVAVLLPLIFTDRLPRAFLAQRYFEPPPPPPRKSQPIGPHVRLIPVDRQFRRGALVQPRTMPPRAARIIDPLLPQDLGPDRPGVVGGIDLPGESGPGVPGGIITGVPQLVPPPPPPPVVSRKPVEEPKVIRVRRGGEVQAAKLVRKVIPVYPPLARQARVSGAVLLQAVIGTNGRVQELQVLGGNPLLVPAALDAVRQWVYEPTLLNGDPVEVITQITVNFTLDQTR